MNRDLDALIQTARSAGIDLMSADRAAQILAVLYVFGGENAAFTHNPGWLAVVRMAQARGNLLGGEMPDAEVVALIKERVSELAPNGILKPCTATDWARDIGDKYNLRLIGASKEVAA